MLTVTIAGNLLNVNLAGKITKEEYEAFEVQLQKLSEAKESLCIYADATGMDGAAKGAIWEDFKNIPAYRNLSRFAVVGDKTWMQVATKFSTIFTKGEVKFFESGRDEEAKRWVSEC
jgi:hypothetical protein